MIIVSKIDYKIYYEKSNLLFIIAIILLILVAIPGIGTVRNGSRSWFGIGSFGIQPSEAAKLSLIIFTSKYLCNNNKNLKNIKKGVFPILFITLFVFALIMLQPDFGTGFIILVTIIGLLFIGGVNLKFFIYLFLIGLIGITGLIVVAPYRLKIILSFLNPWTDPLGSGFQIIQSLYAIGPGGLFGYGFLNSRQKHFYLPEPQTDFIFSIISEEFGFMGVVIVSTLFLIIIIRGLKIAKNIKEPFVKFLAFGIVFGLLACGLSFIFEKEIYIFIAALFFYIGETYMGYIFNFLPLKISESVVAFNTLYSTGEIFIPIITLFIIDVILITYEMKKQRGFIDD